MGICSSCQATNVATAKLILVDGRLQEFPYPIKVSYVLQKNPACFICNADEMDFNDVVSAMSEDEELMPGQLYFALPLSRLSHRLMAEEMAALAVKASSALSKSVGGMDLTSRNVGEFELKQLKKTVGGGNVGSGRRRSGGSGRRDYSAKLSAIPAGVGVVSEMLLGYFKFVDIGVEEMK